MEPRTSAGRLVAVVVTYNRLDQLKRTLARLFETSGPTLEAVVVIDNASTDDTAAWLATLVEPRLHVHRSQTNGGGAQGFATGMRLAAETYDPDWMVVMDEDARPDPGGLETFHGLDLTQWDGVAAAVYLPSGEICEMNRPSRNPFWDMPAFWRTITGGGRGGFHLRPEDYTAPHSTAIDVTSFVGFFISRAGLARAGYPDPGLFLYGDDGLYTLNLRRAGGRIGFEPSVRFEHDLTTFAGQRGRFRPLWKVYYYHRNLLMLYRLAAGWMFWPALLVVLPKWLLKTRDHSGQRRVFLALMARAIRDGLAQRTAIPHTTVLSWVEKE